MIVYQLLQKEKRKTHIQALDFWLEHIISPFRNYKTHTSIHRQYVTFMIGGIDRLFPWTEWSFLIFCFCFCFSSLFENYHITHATSTITVLCFSSSTSPTYFLYYHFPYYPPLSAFPISYTIKASILSQNKKIPKIIYFNKYPKQKL